MNNYNKKWFLLIILSVIWGSSFILIKKALVGLEASQLGSLRIIFSSIFIFLIAWRNIFSIKKIEWKWITISAFLGSFFPAFLFAFAEKEIDSLIETIKQKYPSEWNLIKSCSLKNILEGINQDLKNFNVDFDVWFKESSLGDLSDDKSQLTKSINKLQEGGKT